MSIKLSDLIPKHLIHNVEVHDDYQCLLINSSIISNENKGLYMLLLKNMGELVMI